MIALLTLRDVGEYSKKRVGATLLNASRVADTEPLHSPDEILPDWYFAVYRLFRRFPTRLPVPDDSNWTPFGNLPQRLNAKLLSTWETFFHCSGYRYRARRRICLELDRRPELRWD